MQWMIGLDLRREGRGAYAFARWLHAHATDPAAQSFVPVHVLEQSSLLSALETEQLAKVEADVRDAVREELSTNSLDPFVEEPVVLSGIDADAGLIEQAEARSVDAIILGRRADAEDERWTRLGRVARRMIRALPAPTIIVPPDTEQGDIGEGPVIVATDLRPESSGAARFAKRFADAIGRQVVAMHIVPSASSAASYVPAATVEQLYHQIGLEREKSLAAWARDNGLGACPAIVATGDVVARVLAIADEERPPLVVCGSRQLTMGARLFTASVGAALAGFSRCPVAVVPPA